MHFTALATPGSRAWTWSSCEELLAELDRPATFATGSADGPGGPRRPRPGVRGRVLQRRRHGLAAAQLLSSPPPSGGSPRSAWRWIRRRSGTTATSWPPPARFRRRRRWSTCTAPPTGPPADVLPEETALEETLPFFTVTEMLQRNGIPHHRRRRAASSSAAALASPRWCCRSSSARRRSCRAPWSTAATTGRCRPPVGNPPVAEHFDATRTIVEFWRRHAGLP